MFKTKYFLEIKYRLLFILLSFLFSFLISYIFVEEYFFIIARPLYESHGALDFNSTLSTSEVLLSSQSLHKQDFIFTQLSEAFLTYIYTAFFFTILLNIPLCIYHL